MSFQDYIPTFLRSKGTTLEKAPITIEETKKYFDLLANRRGEHAIAKELAEQIKVLQEQLDTLKNREKRQKGKLREKKMPAKEAKEARAAIKAKLDHTIAAVNKLELDLTIAEKHEEDTRRGVVQEEKQVESIQRNLKKVEESFNRAKSANSLFQALKNLKPGERPLGIDTRPSPEDMRDAVVDCIPDIDALADAKKGRMLTCLNFLRLNGVTKAKVGYNSPEPILRSKLLQILFPDYVPERAQSLSPASKAKQRAAEILEEGSRAGQITENKRAAKRNRDMEELEEEAIVRPAKKAKIDIKTPDTKSAMKEARAKLSQESFAALAAVFFQDETKETNDEDDTSDDGIVDKHNEENQSIEDGSIQDESDEEDEE